ADRIWIALGDTSQDVNWYSKRAILSGVYGSTLLYWLGDETPAAEATWAFLDRRIAGVMQFEKFKARINQAPLTNRLMDGPLSFLRRIQAPGSDPADMPGRWSG
ncbi:MAG: COQ9 family protein, partial [Pseudomonadota bacterium]